MSIFGGRKQQRTSLTGENSREAVTASLRSVQANHYSRTAQREGPRQPDNNIGVAKLLEVYDDYPIVVEQLERTTERMEAAEQTAQEAERKRDDLQADLDDERKGRQRDLEDAAEDKRRSVIAKEKSVRDELNPKIKDLQERLASVTKDRDALQKEISDRKREMKKWIDGMQRLHAERANAAERERKAVEDKKSVDDRLKDLDKTILDGLKKATGAAAVSDAAGYAADTRATPARATPATSEKTRFVEDQPSTPVTPARPRAWDPDYVTAEDHKAMAEAEPKEPSSTRKSVADYTSPRKSIASPSPAAAQAASTPAPETPAAKSEKPTPVRPNAATRRKSSFATSKPKRNDEYGNALDDMLAGKLAGQS